MSDSILYYAYGSNLHPERLGARIPSSQFLCIAPLSGYQLCFHKRGEDLSAKCNAAYSGSDEHQLLGAVFRMKLDEKPILDEIEGEGYVVDQVDIHVEGQLQEAFMYVAEEPYIKEGLKPFQWYKDFVHLGAQYHDFPEDYLAAISCVEAVDDSDPVRHQRNVQVLTRMR